MAAVTLILSGAGGAVAGAVAGLVFYGGLAATVRRLPDSPWPGALVAGSLVVRLALMVATLVGLAVAGPVPLVSAAGSVLVVRTVLLRRAGPTRPSPSRASGVDLGGGDLWT